mmetsp:Transcript_86902/g.225772  ORF Transcript_86902/g.225772 Transcript_86902/m.225772 type:complete len:230 (+) Transcript_86902:187-876(+)
MRLFWCCGADGDEATEYISSATIIAEESSQDVSLDMAVGLDPGFGLSDLRRPPDIASAGMCYAPAAEDASAVMGADLDANIGDDAPPPPMRRPKLPALALPGALHNMDSYLLLPEGALGATTPPTSEGNEGQSGSEDLVAAIASEQQEMESVSTSSTARGLPVTPKRSSASSVVVAKLAQQLDAELHTPRSRPTVATSPEEKESAAAERPSWRKVSLRRTFSRSTSGGS